MGCFGFHHFGTFLLLVSGGLLLVSVLTAPVTRIALFKVSDSTRGDLVVGVLGYCRVLDNASDICSSPSVGWSLTTALSFAFGNDYINEALNRVTYGLVMHIVACAITFLAFIIAACSNRFGYVIAAVFASIAWLATLVTLAIDLAVVLPARSRLTDAGATVEFGIGFWCTIAAAVTLFLGAIAKLFSLCTERSKKRRGGKGQSYAAVVPPVMGHAGYGHGSRDGAALEQQPAYGGKY